MHEYDIIMMPLCQDDILNITKYVTFSFKTPECALNSIREFQNSFKSLLFNPSLNNLDNDILLANYEIRSLHYKKYKIYYYVSITEQIVYVLRVLHRKAQIKSVYLLPNH